MPTPLCDLCVKYGTDKVIWGYTPHYFERLLPIREKVTRVLEVGICGFRDIPNNVVGASLFVWKDFFPNATICGVDNDGRFIFNDQQRIKTYQCDAYDNHSLRNALQFFDAADGFDFIVDDAVHDPIPQISLMHDLWPFLRKGGLYAIEDVCPYKLPGHNMMHMLKLLPEGPGDVQVVATHKDERLILRSRY